MLFEVKYPFNGVQWKSEMHHRRGRAQEIFGCCAGLMLMYVGVVELLRNLPLYGVGFVLTINTRLRYPARRSYRTIDTLKYQGTSSQFLDPAQIYLEFREIISLRCCMLVFESPNFACRISL